MDYDRMHITSRPINDVVQPSGLRSASGANGSKYPTGLRCEIQPNDQKQEAVTENQVQLNEKIWRDIHESRNSNCDKSNELGPADRYAYARMDVSKRGLSQFLGEALLLVPGEQAIKLVTPDSILQKYFSEGNCAVSPPSLDALFCGWEGAIDGLLDYLKSVASGQKGSSSFKDGSIKERIEVKELARTDTLDARERDFLDGREWA